MKSFPSKIYFFLSCLVCQISWVGFSSVVVFAADSRSHLFNLTINELTVEAVQKHITRRYQGHDVISMPLRQLYFFKTDNYFDLKQHYARSFPKRELHAILISNGSYDIATIEKIINDPSIIKKIDKKTYILYQPIILSPTASLVIENIELRMSVRHASGMFYYGHLVISNSSLLSWNDQSNKFAVRDKVKDEDLLLYNKQAIRPFVLGLNGSEGWFVNSLFKGLGYKGKASFGISITSGSYLSEQIIDELTSLIKTFKPSKAIIIGNNIEDCFFGYYSNRASSVRLVGNLFKKNIIYNMDPHDYSEDLIIARNVTYKAGHAHGIILSREVNQAQIKQNLTLFNYGTGIMLDRNSSHNQVSGNISYANSGDGIAVYESDQNQIINNLTFANGNDGIYVRNSENIVIENNRSLLNGNNGMTAAISDLDFLETRDFSLDPYHKSSSSVLRNNTLSQNVKSAVSIKGGASLFIQGNDFSGSGSLYFSGELKPDTFQIIEGNQLDGYQFPKVNVGDKQ